MKGTALEDGPEVALRGGLLFGVNEVYERLAEQGIGLLAKMVSEDRVEVEKT